MKLYNFYYSFFDTVALPLLNRKIGTIEKNDTYSQVTYITFVMNDKYLILIYHSSNFECKIDCSYSFLQVLV